MSVRPSLLALLSLSLAACATEAPTGEEAGADPAPVDVPDVAREATSASSSATVAELSARIDALEASVSSLSSTVAQQNETIAEQTQTITAQNTLIAAVQAEVIGQNALIDGLEDELEAQEEVVESLEDELAVQVAALEDADAALGAAASEVAALSASLAALTATVGDHVLALDALDADVAAILDELPTAGQLALLAALEPVLSVTDNALGGVDLTVTGANVLLRSGAGSSGADNGLGNLVVGYNESDGTEDRSGSHNVVIGNYHAWTGQHGLVAGFRNDVGDRSVALGTNNRASGYGSVLGGENNEVTGPYGVVVGGASNSVLPITLDTRVGGHAVLLGGDNATVREGEYGVVTGVAIVTQ